MKLHYCVIPLAVLALAVSCATPKPDISKDLLRTRLDRIALEEINFKNEDTAAVLAYMLDVANVAFAERPIDEGPLVERFRAMGITNTISLQMKNVAYLDAIQEITKRAGLRYEIQNDRLLFVTRSGVVLNE